MAPKVPQALVNHMEDWEYQLVIFTRFHHQSAQAAGVSPVLLTTKPNYSASPSTCDGPAHSRGVTYHPQCDNAVALYFMRCRGHTKKFCPECPDCKKALAHLAHVRGLEGISPEKGCASL